MPPAFRIDAGTLEDRYRELQMSLHPDRYASAGSRERQLAARASAQVNDAYRVLKDECERAAYLLKISGVELNDETGKIEDTGFLMEQMSLRESLDDSLKADDPLPALYSLSDQAALGRREMLEIFERAWKDGAYDEACKAVGKARFFHQLAHDVNAMKHQVERSGA